MGWGVELEKKGESDLDVLIHLALLPNQMHCDQLPKLVTMTDSILELWAKINPFDRVFCHVNEEINTERLIDGNLNSYGITF